MAVDDGTVGDGGRTADFQAETVERACADRFAGACHDALRHFVRGRLGERQYENLFGVARFVASSHAIYPTMVVVLPVPAPASTRVL